MNRASYIHFLEGCISKVELKKGDFATSAIVNADARLISDDDYHAIADHFRSLGYVVHSPPTRDIWNQACQNHKRNDLAFLRWGYKEDEDLQQVILVAVPKKEAGQS